MTSLDQAGILDKAATFENADYAGDRVVLLPPTKVDGHATSGVVAAALRDLVINIDEQTFNRGQTFDRGTFVERRVHEGADVLAHDEGLIDRSPPPGMAARVSLTLTPTRPIDHVTPLLPIAR